MVSFTSTLLAVTTVVGALAFPTQVGPRSENEMEARSTPNQQGQSGGYFYQFWSEGGGDVTYTNGAGGEYSVTWQNVDDFTAGKGWQQVTGRAITFSGTFNPGTNGYLAVYTWSGIGETYILENLGLITLAAAYCSIRRQKRTSGTVTTSNHYNWYNAHGLPFNPSTNATYQIVSTEGFGSSGSATITVEKKDEFNS
ncbi:hypothetical protein ZTR_01262 [Talaromyces verruculosus]|nr:hypothetical protein ZTR_01262 [Talaromyces verruculosus]